jgi:hypothetical protein
MAKKGTKPKRPEDEEDDRPMAKKKRIAKPTIKKAHKIARRIPRGKVDNPYAVGMSAAKKAAAKRKRKRARKR